MLLLPSEVPLTVPQLSGANSKLAYKDRGKQISCLSSDASPVSAVTAWSFYLRADYLLGIPRLRHSVWFGHVDGPVRQIFACSPFHCRTSSSRHAIERKFVGVMLRRALAGSQVSRQLTETNSYSPSSAYYCWSYFPGAMRRKWPIKGAPLPQRSPLYAATDAICVKSNWIDEESKVISWKIWLTKQRVEVMREEL